MSGLSLNPYPKILITNKGLMYAPPNPSTFQMYLHYNRGKLGPAEGTQIVPVEFEFQALATSMQ